MAEFDKSIIWLSKVSKCWHCGKLTHLVDVDFEAHLCSSKCQQAKIKEWQQACIESDRRVEDNNTNW